ncbi:MAG: LysM peptidoglycan-binding domain-containing protein [Chloroflexota bacterium]
MTERGLPGTDGAPACPFVAFGDDREARSTSPDHRHRCFADTPPAPRALAHQEAYCLSSAFPVCPIFQDWARREAAQTRAGAGQAEPAAAAAAAATPAAPTINDLYAGWGMPPSSETPADEASMPPADPDEAPRQPERDWSAPPPWATGAAVSGAMGGRPAVSTTPPASAATGGSPDPDVQRPVEGQGLAGSGADRMAAGEVPAAVAWSASAGGHPSTAADDELAGLVQPRQNADPAAPSAGSPARDDRSVPAAALAAAAAGAAASSPAPESASPAADTIPPGPGSPQPIVRSTEGYPPSTRTGKRPSVSSTRDATAGPSWERMQHVDSYPRIKGESRMRGVPRAALFAGALGIAALILFMLPAIIGFGGGGSSSSASPKASGPASAASASPTAIPAPTPVVYVIKKGDTLSKVANKFDVQLEDLLAANPTITNPNKISLGQEIIIPTGSAAPSIAPTAKATGSTAP